MLATAARPGPGWPYTAAVAELAVTVVGHDRPGIVADVSRILAGLGLNLTDSTMTRLRGHFAMTLVCTGDAEPAAVESALAPLCSDGSLQTTAWQVRPEEEIPAEGSPYVVSVHGADRLGIVAAVTGVLARAGGNITDLTTRLADPLYVLVAEVDVPDGVAEDLAAALAVVADELGVDVTVRGSDTDVL